MSIFGRILLCKTYVQSLFAYVFQSLSLPKKVIEEIDSMCFKYIWNSNTNSKRVIEKIKRSVMCLELKEGGANMIKLADQQQLFLLRWVKRTAVLKQSLLNSTNISNLYFSWFGKEEYFLEFCCPGEMISFPKFFSRFWADVLCCYLNNKDKIVRSNQNWELNQFFEEPIFFNSNITYKNKILCFRTWIQAGLKYINQVKNGSSLKSYNEIRDIVGNYGNLIFEYNMLKNSSITKVPNISKSPREINLLLTTFFSLKNDQQRKIISQNNSQSICGMNFWSKHLKTDVLPLYSASIASIKEIKMRHLLFKIFHNIFPSNYLLNKYKIRDSNKCVCGEIDHIDHYFVDCVLIKEFWRDVKNHIFALTNFNLPNSTSIRLFGLDPTDENNVLTINEIANVNYILILAKSAISTAKYYNSVNYSLYFENLLSFRKKYLKEQN